jgi:hypothetical protein
MELSEHVLKWSERLRQQQVSGKSARAWCMEQSVPYRSFCAWRQRLQAAQEPQHELNCSGFTELPREDVPWLEISLRGAKLALHRNFDLAGLLRCMQMLQVK